MEETLLFVGPDQLKPKPVVHFLNLICIRAKQDAERSRAFLYPGHSHVVPHRGDTILTAFSDIFPTPNAFRLQKPENFSEIVDCLAEIDPFHGYEPPDTDRGSGPHRLGTHYWTHDKRYALILAAVNTVIMAQNAVMCDAQIFDTIDIIKIWGSGFINDFQFERIEDADRNGRPYAYNCLNLFIDYYRELDQLVHRRDREGFWPQIISTVTRFNRTNVEHTHRDWTTRTWQRVEEMISGDNKELKEEICSLLERREYSESTVSAIFDLLMSNHMENM